MSCPSSRPLTSTRAPLRERTACEAFTSRLTSTWIIPVRSPKKVSPSGTVLATEAAWVRRGPTKRIASSTTWRMVAAAWRAGAADDLAAVLERGAHVVHDLRGVGRIGAGDPAGGVDVAEHLHVREGAADRVGQLVREGGGERSERGHLVGLVDRALGAQRL